MRGDVGGGEEKVVFKREKPWDSRGEGLPRVQDSANGSEH